MIRAALKVGAQASAVVVSGGVGYGFYKYETDEGTKRMIKAYSTFVPVVLHYRMVESRHHLAEWIKTTANFDDGIVLSEDEEWDALDETYAVSTVAKLGDLQGMYCKYGQTAAGFTNTFGDAWIHEFRKLENEVPPRPVESIYKTIEEETGKPVEETFSYIDPKPLGSASIGQVHRAILKENGKEVAVKVQYPEAQALFHEDIYTIRSFCEAFAPEHIVVLDALEKQNRAELDYTLEAQNLLEVSQNMIRHGFQPREVLVPQPIPELTTHRMLVMELLPGLKLVDGVNAYFSKWAEQHGTTLHDLEQEARERIEKEGIPAKYDGPSALKIGLYQKSLKIRNKVANAGIGLYNGTIGWVAPTVSYYENSSLPPNIPRIIDTLMRTHGYQLLADGVFNSDPHGGNFLLLPDGRIGMIDYGATKRLTRNERLSVCLLFAALARRDEQLLFTMCDLGGYKSKYGRRDILMKLLLFGYDSWGQDVTGGKNIQQFIDDMKREDPWEEVPDNFVLAQFMSIRLRSLALGMNHPIKCSEWWGPIAEEILEKEGLPYEKWDYEMLVKYKPEMNMKKYKFA